MRPTRAIGYARISEDKAETGEGVSNQDVDIRRYADRIGWGIAEIVVDNDVSAFKRRRVRQPDGTVALRVVREGYAKVLDRLASGECDGLLALDLDRVVRDPRDLEDLIDVVEPRKIPVESVTGSLRLATDADIAMARVMVAIANKSSRDTSRRVARKHEQLAAEGKPGGGGIRAYGYARDGIQIEPAEAAIIRETAERIIGGWSLYKISEDLNARNVPTVRGGPWQSRSVKTMITKPRVAGLRALRGEVVGEAVWEPILDQATWTAVCDVLAQRAGSSSNRLTHWLSGVLYCGLCDTLLTGSTGNGSTRYWCAPWRNSGCGKIAINAAGAEGEVERQVIEYLADPDVLAVLQRARSAPESVQALRASANEDQQMLKDLAAAWARKEITFAEYTEARRIIDQRVKETKVIVSGMTPRVLRRLLDADTTAAAWAELGPFEKREAVRALVPDGYMVVPATRRRSAFDPERLKLRTVTHP